jgi:hypothetical protein
MFRNSSAIYIHPGFVTAKRVTVDGAGNHFLAGASFSDDEYGSRMTGYLFNQPHHAL